MSRAAPRLQCHGTAKGTMWNGIEAYLDTNRERHRICKRMLQAPEDKIDILLLRELAAKAQREGRTWENSDGKIDIPSIDVVEVREEEDSTDEKSDQHKSPIHFVQESVLLFVLRAEKKRERFERERKREKKKSKQYRVVKAHGVNLTCHCYIVNANIAMFVKNICNGLIKLQGNTGCNAAGWTLVDFYRGLWSLSFFFFFFLNILICLQQMS